MSTNNMPAAGPSTTTPPASVSTHLQSPHHTTPTDSAIDPNEMAIDTEDDLDVSHLVHHKH